jgi:hypothetical protein
MVKKLSIFMVSLGFFGSLYPIVSYRLFKGPNGRSVLVLGEHHARDYAPHVKVVTDEFSMVKFSHPLSLAMELNKKKGEVAVSPTTFQIFSFAHALPAKFSVKRIDPRELYSDVMHSFSAKLVSFFGMMNPNLAKLGSSYPYTEIDQQLLDNIKKSTKEEDAVVPREWNLTVGGYLNYLQSCLAKLEECKRRQTREVAPAYEELLLVPYRKALREICVEFAQFNPSMLLESALWQVFQKKCNTPTELYTFYENFDERYIGTIDCSFFDGMLFDYLTEQSDKVCCVLVGDTHARGLKRLFEAVPGWTLLKEESIYRRLSVLFKTVLEPNVPEFLDGLRGTVKEFIRPLVLTTCAVCSRAENLQTCSRCKCVSYCGAACQKSDWQTHKAVCSPVKVEIPS